MLNFTPEDFKNYTIMTLGVQGSGKTVFLASMYHELSTQNPELGFYLKSQGVQQEEQLINIYNKVADLTGGWPPSTKPSDSSEDWEWQFTCTVEANKTSYELLNIIYFDYAGEIITGQEVDSVYGDKFEEALSKADALLVVLDGVKILNFMEATPEESQIIGDLNYLVPKIQRRSIPVHFLITKWDILGKKYLLDSILQKIKTDSRTNGFKNIIHNRTGGDDKKERAIVRIIPVSSVGQGFATKEADSPRMVKTGNKPLDPEQIEVPLACLIHDKLVDRLTELDREKNQLRINWTLSATERMYQALGGASTTIKWFVIIMTTLFFKSRRIISSEENFFNVIKENLRERSQVKQNKRYKLTNIKNQQEAMRHILYRFLDIIEDFEKKFPDALIRPEK